MGLRYRRTQQESPSDASSLVEASKPRMVISRRLILPFWVPGRARSIDSRKGMALPINQRERAMQVIPENILVDEYPANLPQDTDTAHPRTPIPIYYIHALGSPFCDHPSCACRHNLRDVTRLLVSITEGTLELQNAAPLIEGATSNTSGTDQPTVYRVHIPLVEGIPELCQLYGHSWEATEHPGVKVCHLCGIKGYCLACTPRAQPSAQVFYCTAHTRLPRL